MHVHQHVRVLDRGQWSFEHHDVADLLPLMESLASQRGRALSLAGQANAMGWWGTQRRACDPSPARRGVQLNPSWAAMNFMVSSNARDASTTGSVSAIWIAKPSSSEDSSSAN